MDERERYQQGLSVRRDVLGDAYVDRALQDCNQFNQDFQDLITRYAWGDVWARPGLPPQTRSLLTLAMMVALNRGDELRMHVRAAFRTGRIAGLDSYWASRGAGSHRRASPVPAENQDLTPTRAL